MAADALERELVRLNAELQHEYATLLAAQIRAVEILQESQMKAAEALRQSQQKALEILRKRQLEAVANLSEDQKKVLIAAFESAAETLREMQAIAAQREAAAILLEATRHMTQGSHKIS